MSSEAEDRAKRAWEHIFTLVATGQPLPAGRTPSTDASPEELRASLVVAAMALDELYETGVLLPDPQMRIKETMRNLLLVWDGLTPLPEGLLPAEDLTEVIDAIRTARKGTTL